MILTRRKRDLWAFLNLTNSSAVRAELSQMDSCKSGGRAPTWSLFAAQPPDLAAGLTALDFCLCTCNKAVKILTSLCIFLFLILLFGSTLMAGYWCLKVAVVTEVFGVLCQLTVTALCVKQQDFAFFVSLHGQIAWSLSNSSSDLFCHCTFFFFFKEGCEQKTIKNH